MLERNKIISYLNNNCIRVESLISKGFNQDASRQFNNDLSLVSLYDNEALKLIETTKRLYNNGEIEQAYFLLDYSIYQSDYNSHTFRDEQDRDYSKLKIKEAYPELAKTVFKEERKGGKENVFKYEVRKTDLKTYEAIFSTEDGFRISWRCQKYPLFKDYYLMLFTARESYYSRFLPKKIELEKIRKDMGY